MGSIANLFGGSKPPKPPKPPAPRPEQDIGDALVAFKSQNPAGQKSGRELFMSDLMFDDTNDSGLQTARR